MDVFSLGFTMVASFGMFWSFQGCFFVIELAVEMNVKLMSELPVSGKICRKTKIYCTAKGKPLAHVAKVMGEHQCSSSQQKC